MTVPPNASLHRHSVLSVARYGLRTTLAANWFGYLSIVILVGLLGGLGMEAVAGARRTQSAYPTYLVRSHASDLDVNIYLDHGNDPARSYSAKLTAEIAHLHDVKQSGISLALFASPLNPRVDSRQTILRSRTDRWRRSAASTAFSSTRTNRPSHRGGCPIPTDPTSSWRRSPRRGLSAGISASASPWGPSRWRRSIPSVSARPASGRSACSTPRWSASWCPTTKW